MSISACFYSIRIILELIFLFFSFFIIIIIVYVPLFWVSILLRDWRKSIDIVLFSTKSFTLESIDGWDLSELDI